MILHFYSCALYQHYAIFLQCLLREDTSAYRTLWCNANYNLHRYFQIPLICCTTTDLLSCFSSKAIKNLYAQVGMDHQSTVEVFSDDIWSTRKQPKK